MAKFEVEFYEKENGEQPAKEFLLGLDAKMRAKTVNAVAILADNGYELREPYSKHLSEGIFELRAKVGPISQEFCTSFMLTGISSSQTDSSRKRKKLLPEK